MFKIICWPVERITTFSCYHNLQMIRKVLFSSVCTNKANKVEKPAKRQVYEVAHWRQAVYQCTPNSSLNKSVRKMLNIAHHRELNTKPINRLGEMETQNAIQTSGVGTESTHVCAQRQVSLQDLIPIPCVRIKLLPSQGDKSLFEKTP